MVVGPDGFDLLGCDRVPPGTQSLANGARLVFWMMKEIDENVDDTSGMQFLGSRWRGEFLSFRPLPGSWLRLGAEVDETRPATDRKSTRLNSSHLVISYAVFCLKKN